MLEFAHCSHFSLVFLGPLALGCRSFESLQMHIHISENRTTVRVLTSFEQFTYSLGAMFMHGAGLWQNLAYLSFPCS